MWVDQNFPPGEMRKLHIHGSKAQVRAATKEVEALINSAPVNNARPAKGSEVKRDSSGLLFVILNPNPNPNLNMIMKVISASPFMVRRCLQGNFSRKALDYQHCLVSPMYPHGNLFLSQDGTFVQQGFFLVAEMRWLKKLILLVLRWQNYAVHSRNRPFPRLFTHVQMSNA